MKTKKLKKEVDKTIKYLCKEIRNDKCYYEYKDSILYLRPLYRIVFGLQIYLSINFKLELCLEYRIFKLCHHQVMKHLYVIVIWHSVIPFFLLT